MMDAQQRTNLAGSLQAKMMRMSVGDQLTLLDDTHDSLRDGLSIAERDQLATCLNQAISFILSFNCKENERLLQQASNLITQMKYATPKNGSSVLSVSNFLDWIHSDNREILQNDHAKMYLYEVRLSKYSQDLPRLFLQTEMRGSFDLWDTQLQMHSIPARVNIASSAAIQHLRHGDEIPFERVFDAFARDSTVSQMHYNHTHWLMVYNDTHGVIDEDRTRAFLEAYSKFFIEQGRAINPAMADRLVENLKAMCDDSSLIYNQYSKRQILMCDFGLY